MAEFRLEEMQILKLSGRSPLPTYSQLQPLVDGLSFPVTFLYLQLRGSV